MGAAQPGVLLSHVCAGLMRCCPTTAVIDAGHGTALAGQQPPMHPPHTSSWSRAGAADLTLHVEENGGVVGLTGGQVCQGAVELTVGAPGGEGEGAGSARSRAVCLLLPAVEVPRQRGTGGWPGGPAGEGMALLLQQRAHCQRLPVNGGAQLPQPCWRARGTSEPQWGPAARAACQTPPQPHLLSRAPGGRAAAAGRQGQPPATPWDAPWCADCAQR